MRIPRRPFFLCPLAVFMLKATTTTRRLYHMTAKPQDKDCTVFLSQAEDTAIGVEKKRKLSSCSEVTTKFNQIKLALAEVITKTDPKDTKASEIIGHLTTAHVAIETASSLLADNGRMQRTLTGLSGPVCQLSMLERATIFHQRQAKRTIQTSQGDEKIVK